MYERILNSRTKSRASKTLACCVYAIKTAIYNKSLNKYYK